VPHPGSKGYARRGQKKFKIQVFDNTNNYLDKYRGRFSGWKRFGRLGCREITAELGWQQNLNLRNDRLKERTKKDAVQKK
jgi:hypothetical protein